MDFEGHWFDVCVCERERERVGGFRFVLRSSLPPFGPGARDLNVPS